MDTAISPAEAGTAFPPSSRAGKWRGPFKKVSSARHDPSHPSPSGHPAGLSRLTVDEPFLRVRPLISGFLNLFLYSSHLGVMLKSPSPGPRPTHAESEPAGFSQLPRRLLGGSGSATVQFPVSFNPHHSPPPVAGPCSQFSHSTARFCEVGWVVLRVWCVAPAGCGDSPVHSLLFPSRSLCLRGSSAWLLPAGSSAPASAVSGLRASPPSAQAAGKRPRPRALAP